MKKSIYVLSALLVAAVSGWAATSATVNKAGTGGAYTTIQAAIDSGASTVTITDSGTYLEDVQIGDPDTSGPPVTLTSTKTGDSRPVITPVNGHSYIVSRRTGQNAGFGVFANNSVVSNLIIEANGDLNNSAMAVVANNVLLENCLFRIAPGGTGTLGSSNPLLFFGQQGDGSNELSGVTPGGPDSNGCLVRNCEFIGMAPDSDPVEPIGTGVDPDTSLPDGSQGYLDERSSGKGTGQNSGFVRIDILTDTGEDVFITFEGCYFHHSRDYGIFPTNLKAGGGSLNVIVKKCRFDATNKFQLRGRGANVYAESCVFTRACQGNNGDTENSAVAIQTNDGHIPSGSVSNCVFVNDGSAFAQKAYYGGVNNNNGNLLTVENCTFVDCLTGVGAGSGSSGTLQVSKSIFHQIGDNVPPSVDAAGITLTNGSPELINGLYPACTNGLNFSSKWSGVFNRFNWDNTAQIIIDTCLVGDIASEDTRSWADALATNEVTGCRLFCGYETNFVNTGGDTRTNFVGADTVTRGTPVFVNTDPDAPNAFQLTAGSPGQGLGAELARVLEPKLNISKAADKVTITWSQSIWMKSLVLKSTGTLTNPAWNPVAAATTDGVNYSASVTIGTTPQFFAVLKQ